MIDDLLRQDGIESWVRSGRKPWIHEYGSSSRRFYLIYVPTENATQESWLSLDKDGDVACFLNENDKEGKKCLVIQVNLEQGNEIVKRMTQECEKIRIEKSLYNFLCKRKFAAANIC